MESDIRREHIEDEGGPVPPDAEDAHGDAIHNPSVGSPHAATSRGHGGQPSQPSENDAAQEGALEGRIDSERQEEITAAVVQAVMAVERSESYSGLIPHPKHWDKFDAGTQERILRMSEAYTTDESARRDRIVDAEIAEAPKGRQNALLIMMTSLVLAAISVFVFSNTVAAGIFLAVPLANIVRDFISGRRSANRADNDSE